MSFSFSDLHRCDSPCGIICVCSLSLSLSLCPKTAIFFSKTYTFRLDCGSSAGFGYSAQSGLVRHLFLSHLNGRCDNARLPLCITAVDVAMVTLTVWLQVTAQSLYSHYAHYSVTDSGSAVYGFWCNVLNRDSENVVMMMMMMFSLVSSLLLGGCGGIIQVLQLFQRWRWWFYHS